MSMIPFTCALLMIMGFGADAKDAKPNQPRIYQASIRVEGPGMDGKQRCLAQPTLVFKEGTAACFMPGGEMPFKTGEDRVAYVAYGLKLNVKVVGTTDQKIRAEFLIEHSKAADVTGAVYVLSDPQDPAADALPQADGDLTLRSKTLRLSRELPLGKTLVIVEKLADEAPPHRIYVTIEEARGGVSTENAVRAPVPVGR